MQALLDTHTFLWWVLDDPRLSAEARTILADSSNELYFSAASSWEIAIKAQLGKIGLPNHFEPFIAEQLLENNFIVLPIQLSHTLHIYTLPLLHHDPFDRILVAQSQLEKLPLITSDPLIMQYNVNCIG